MGSVELLRMMDLCRRELTNRVWLTPAAAAGHSLSEDGSPGSALHWVPSGEEGSCQLHKDSGERHDSG